MIRKTIFLIISVLAFTVSAKATSGGGGSSTTYYSKLTVKTSNSQFGKVYVSKSETNNPQYADESSATNDGSSKSQTYYLYAQPTEGYLLDYWSTNASGTTRTVEGTAKSYSFNASSEDQNSPTELTLYAIFRDTPPPVTVSSNNERLGTAYVANPGNNYLNKTITVTAKYAQPSKWTSGDFLSVHSKSVKFDGWYVKGTNECKSMNLSYQFPVTEPIELEARFSFPEQYISGTDGYYRVKCAFNSYTTVAGSFPSGSEKYLSIEGNYNIGVSNGRDITPCIYYSNNPYSDPSNILRITGKNYKSLDVNNYNSQQTILESVDLGGQGTSTKIVTKQDFKIVSTEQPGLYKLVYSSYCLYNGYEGADFPFGALTISNNYSTGEEAMRSFDFLPLNEDHIDEYFFGAEPDEDMLFDNGYWTSMYTGFPYSCNWGENFEGDGVEAYYVKSDGISEDGEIVILEKIEDGIVPAYTAVLLKCKSLDPSENRLLPLLDDGDPIEDNLLDGSFQLNTNNQKNDKDKTKFASATMRVLDVKDGEVGFYTIEENTLLTANKAWLNVGNISAKAKIRFRTDTSTFVEGISINTPAEDENAPIYNLQGVIVKNPIPGQIYIKNGKKFIAR